MSNDNNYGQNPQTPPPAGPHYAPYQPAPVKQKMSTGKKVGIGAAVVVGLMIAANAGGGDTETTTTTLADGTTITVPATTSAAAKGPKTSFGPGTWLVGKDIAPGTYRASNGTGSFDVCYWERQSNTSGDFDAIIANEAVTEKGASTIVTIDPTDVAFKTSGCTTWELV
jgi:hypothetical protein